MRLEAPVILFGRRADTPTINRDDPLPRFDPPAHTGDGPGRGRHLSVPAGHMIKAALLVSGRLEIGEGCHVIGDLRAGRGIIIGRNVVIEGAVYSDGSISIGACCRIVGPIVARNQITLGTQGWVGSPIEPATMLAEQIRIYEGSVVHGSVIAYRQGEVVDERNPG
ncbi:MAG: hypothetical protein CGU28_16375 [Candidatus Dactylopiibacterium carminicum]|uniref:Cell shape determination protein CcmA n=1 Tax=Candidatus Dactylopiibacterium carminicum TaxID=857335 RepID=A0A272EMW2_9RHOO|nr:polymer-forming cytoskeletal protein [Candidatus Dactylopiibacterium carminicum]KAF7597856.1 hypothetical protein BGI27_16460 [Candidatus Dactylopiibacterium carminicum]PAS91445.1 MAG: hypothetical protein CGU29_16415 [Candidatus Dactylopiibacterium carminicum]PAS92618.1 MAG: hypothetical protein CGU28_16375 [Candidatus Dactylopiibacterium carminicum]PAS95752.1 MAG: hypothetical protein BSR46_16500 [Candidatus Dactylopiibacterium carminicum]